MADYNFERSFWGDCCNTFYEDRKHYVYAKYMGIDNINSYLNVYDKNILDIGGGPTSMLLKTINLKKGKIYDPIIYPEWTVMRYKCKNIEVKVECAENMYERFWDEVWIYNCLQHVIDPEKIINNALKSAKVLRIFEWIDIPPHEGHPHMLTETSLNTWLGYDGNCVDLSEDGCFGKAYYNIVSI